MGLDGPLVSSGHEFREVTTLRPSGLNVALDDAGEEEVKVLADEVTMSSKEEG